MAELLCEGFNKDFQVSYLRRWILHANIPTFSTASFFPQCNTKHFSTTAKEKKQGSLLMCFWCSYRELLMRAPLSSKRQKSNDSWLPSCRHRHHPPLPGTAHPAPTPGRINFTAKRAEENPSPQARAKSIPGLLPPVPNLPRSFPHSQLSLFHAKSSSEQISPLVFGAEQALKCLVNLYLGLWKK